MIVQKIMGEAQTEENAGKKGSEADALKLWPKMDVGYNIPAKPPPSVATQVNRNGLIKM